MLLAIYLFEIPHLHEFNCLDYKLHLLNTSKYPFIIYYCNYTLKYQGMWLKYKSTVKQLRMHVAALCSTDLHATCSLPETQYQ